MKEYHPGTPLASQPKYVFWNRVSMAVGFVAVAALVASMFILK